MPSITITAVAELCGGMAEGDTGLELSGANSLAEAQPNEISFVANARAAQAAQTSRAGCLLTPLEYPNLEARTIIRVADPRAAFARVVALLHPAARPVATISPSAVIAASAQIEDGCYIGPHVSIGERVNVGRNSVIHAGCTLESDVTIGERSILYPHVTIYAQSRLGARVTLHAGCVIGADGFGFAFTGDHYEKFSQIGTVEIGDDVELGANTCVDRAALGVTRIGDGTKIDNMVHVGHNCQIGKHVVIAAQTGLSGGVSIGDYAVVGGQVGVGDKAKISEKAVIGSGAGILTSKIVRAGEPVWGTPARPLREHLQQLAALSRLPALLQQIKALEERLRAVEKNSS